MLKQLQKRKAEGVVTIAGSYQRVIARPRIRSDGFTISASQQSSPRAAAAHRRPGFASPRIRSDGFTIIEVLIVLAIAGLILVVVFFAVPALQRSSRNTALNTDARNILAAVANFTAANGGALPAAQAAAAPSGGSVTIGAAGTNQEAARVDNAVATLQIDAGATPITNASAIGTVEVVTGTKGVCNITNTGLSATPASPRSHVVMYVAESGSGNILKCIGN